MCKLLGGRLLRGTLYSVDSTANMYLELHVRESIRKQDLGEKYNGSGDRAMRKSWVIIDDYAKFGFS